MWVCSLYPLWILGSLYATWLTAWCGLGHRPRSSLDDPRFISPIVDVPYVLTFLLVQGVPFILLLCPALLIAAVARTISQGTTNRSRRPLTGSSPPYCGGFACGCHPSFSGGGIPGILYWYMD